MKKFSYFLFMGLIILLVYTLFAMQNRISIPLRITFSEPKIYFLPLIVLFSFIAGTIFSSIFILIYRWNFPRGPKSACDILAYPAREEGRPRGINSANSDSEQPLPSPYNGNNSGLVESSISPGNNCPETPLPDLEYGKGQAVSNPRISGYDKETEVPYSHSDKFVTEQPLNIIGRIRKIIRGSYKA